MENLISHPKYESNEKLLYVRNVEPFEAGTGRPLLQIFPLIFVKPWMVYAKGTYTGTDCGVALSGMR